MQPNPATNHQVLHVPPCVKSTTDAMSEQSPTIESMSKVAERELAQTTFAVLDLETSGASPKTGSAITEIGAVKVRGGEIIGTFQTFVNPGTPLPPFITHLTGITDQMLAYAPKIETILPLLLEFFRERENNRLCRS